MSTVSKVLNPKKYISDDYAFLVVEEHKMFFRVNIVGIAVSDNIEPTINNIHHAQSFDSQCRVYAIYRNHNPRFRFVSLTTCLLSYFHCLIWLFSHFL